MDLRLLFPQYHPSLVYRTPKSHLHVFVNPASVDSAICLHRDLWAVSREPTFLLHFDRLTRKDERFYLFFGHFPANSRPIAAKKLWDFFGCSSSQYSGW